MDYVIQKTKRKLKLNKRKSPAPLSVKTIHYQKLKHFEDLQNVILPKKLKELKSCSMPAQLEREIRDIKERIEETDYYFSCAKILDEYFLLETCPNTDGNSRKIEIVREYYNALDIPVPKEYSPDLALDCDRCKKCGNNDNIVETDSQGLVCGDCGFVLDNIHITDTLSYKDKQTFEHCVVMDYKRVDYFKQWLNQIQAKEQTEIPREVIDTVIIQLKIERIVNISKISVSSMKRILKKTNNSKYYEHIPSIINAINKVPPLNIPVYVEKKLIAMFEEIQAPWSMFKTKDRKNFFSYPYTIHKFCQILGLKEYLSYFPMLKSREKLYRQDTTWKKIMEHLQNNKSKNPMLSDVIWKYHSSF